MKIGLLASAACAALTILAAPATGASVPATPYAQAFAGSVDQDIEGFYASRNGAQLWLTQGSDSPAAREMLSILQRGALDGLASGPALAARAESVLARARGGDPTALAVADRLLSSAWVLYVQSLQRPPAGMTIADGWAAPRQESAQSILQRAAAARSKTDHLRTVSSVNPIYAEIREAAWRQRQTTGSNDPRVLATLERIRAMPFQKRYIVVDAASARLWMVENGQIADSMKVIVGKSSSPTPMLASTIYYATLNPYWNVPQDLVRKLIAPRVLDQGVSYLKTHGYEVLSDYSPDAQPVSPSEVDWRAVADGRAVVKVRQLPGPANSMGQVKFGFPNANDIFLHDTPKKDLFAQADRDLSNGCIRLEDAERLSRWLIGREPTATSAAPEQHVLLPKPVPVYVTYLTAVADGGELAFVDDVYGRDRQATATMAGLR